MLATTVKRINRTFGKDKDFKEIAKGGSLSFVINIAGLGFGYVFVILVSKIYGDSSAGIYGKYVLVTLLLRIASILTRFGSDTAMLRFTAAFAPQKLWGNIKELNKKFLLLLLGLGSFVTLVVIVFSAYWGKVLKLPQPLVIVTSIFIIPLALGLFYSQSLRGLKKIGISSFLRTSALPTFNFVLLPLFVLMVNKQSTAYNDLPSYTFFAAIVLTALIGFISWYRFVPSNKNNDAAYNTEHTKTYKELLKNSYPLVLVESMVFIGGWIDQLMLGVMGTNEDVGIFNLCFKYCMLITLSLQSVNTISAPKFADFFFRKDYKNLAKSFKKTTKMIFWTSFPAAAALIVFPHFFLNLFGNSFNTGSLALIVLSISSIINIMTGSVGILLQMTGHQKIMQNILLISIVIEIAVNALLIPRIGVTGAAIASMVGSAIKNFGMSYYVKKYFNFNSIYFPVLSSLSNKAE